MQLLVVGCGMQQPHEKRFLFTLKYRIAVIFMGKNIRGFVVFTGPQIFYPRMKRPYLLLPAVQAATMTIKTTKWLNIAEPRIF